MVKKLIPLLLALLLPVIALADAQVIDDAKLFTADEVMQTRQMLDIIRDGAVMPFEYAYSTMIAGEYWPNQVLSYSTWKMDGQVASMLEKTSSIWEANIEKTLEAYAD